MVNIKNFKSPEIGKGDRLEAIFKRQTELMKKYHVIEATSGLLQTYEVPVNLDDAKGQARIKDFAWRCTEELMEAMDAYRNKTHFGEEIADAFHFLVELTILAGYSNKDVVENFGPYKGIYEVGGDDLDLLYSVIHVENVDSTLKSVMDFLIALGMTCHTLKNKPWVQTQRVTDKKEFKRRLLYSFLKFIRLCFVTEIDAQSLYDLYFRKSEVNKFRQRSRY
jgi:hypothetical protein